MWQSMTITKPGKWVLAGEHAVLRGATALALPHPGVALTLRYEPGDESLRIEPAAMGPLVKDLIGLLSDCLASGCDRRDGAFTTPKGSLLISSSIPIGAGLGSSAALCVAITSWVSSVVPMTTVEERDLARRLEDRFHGRSSGMDVSVVAIGQPIAFQMDEGAKPLTVTRLPRFTFHDTGLRARTSVCVEKVFDFMTSHPALSVQTDEAMGQAARWAMEGLVRFDAGDTTGGIGLIADAMKQAQECFETWDLVPPEARRAAEKLYAEGARGVKLTGAGAGGFLVALWD